jgi:RimJ/RimL family protein N-acetyltransferase
MIQDKLSTQRLHLERLQPDDHAFMRALVNTPGWIEFIGDRNVHSQADALAYIDRIMNTENLYYWVARTRETNTPIGVVSFLKRSYLDHFDIGFAFLPEFQGAGYALEGAKAVLDMVRDQPEYQPVLATILPHNVNSVRLLEKLGLRFERIMQVNEDTLHIYTTSAEQPV